METTIEYTDKKTAWVSTDEVAVRNRLLRYAEEYPDDVNIIKSPNENWGCLYMTVPVSWIKIKPPKKISDERKAALAEALRSAREKKNEAV